MPLVSAVKVDKSTETPTTPAQAQTVLPIFETSLETQNPIEDLTPEHSMNNADERVGYFELNGKLHKGYLTPIAGITEVDVHITKVPNITKGFGRQGEAAHVASNNYYAVFPNGKTFLFIKNNPVQGGMSESQVEDSIRKALLGNPQRMKDLASEKTILFDPDAVPTVSVAPITTVETPATINQGNTQTGAAYTAQKEKAINDHDEEFEDEFILRRTKDTTETPVWNQEKELKWLNKVLPQLSEQDRVKVVKGLIKVGRQGALAWGQFDKGVITLSDIAAEGTAYHEAFHTVFNLLLDNDERQALYDEASKLYGEKDNLSLEEDMAEGFREYVTTRQNAGLLGKIKNFFKDLWIKVTNWNSVRPHLTAYYQMINRGEYSNKELPVETLSQARARQEEYSKEMQNILANAKRDPEGNLLAPNGKKSNLTERQYAQVRTKAFKDWFGDWENNSKNASKVVDENGEPLVVYHGGSNTKVFNTKGGQFGAGIKKGDIGTYFTPFEKSARGYEEIYNYKIGEKWLTLKELADNGELSEEDIKSLDEAWENEKPNTRAFFLNIRNPKITNFIGDNTKGFNGEDSNIGDNNDGQFININSSKPKEYVAFNPNQIKSATANVGTFSRTNDDIRYREVPNSSFKSLDTEMQENLLKKGWTEEKFDSVSQEERDQAIKCIAF